MLKREDSVSRLIFLFSERGVPQREIHEKFLNPLLVRKGVPSLTDIGIPEKPYYRGVSRRVTAGRDVTDPTALKWAEKMLPRLLDETGQLRNKAEVTFTIGAIDLEDIKI